MALSERQQRMFEFITKFSREKGRPPTIREIGTQVGISSTSVVNYNLNILQREGYIQREKEVSRGLRVVIPGAKTLADAANFVQIPLLGKIAAGHPMPVPETGFSPYEGEVITLTRDLIQDQENLFALQVKGNSMIDALINDGDIVVMKSQNEAHNGEMVAVWLKDKEETTLKHFFLERPRGSKPRVRLQPANRTMKPIYVDPANVEIQGKVVAVLRQLA